MKREECSQRRLLLREGYALLTYALGRSPSCMLVRRYVRAIEASGDVGAVMENRFLLRFPVCLFLVDSPAERTTGGGYSRRLQVATRIAEVSVEGADHFLMRAASGRVSAYLQLTWVVLKEAFRIPLRLALGWLFRPSRAGS